MRVFEFYCFAEIGRCVCNANDVTFYRKQYIYGKFGKNKFKSRRG